MKTLAELRNDCKKYGIKVKKESLSWGPHISFLIAGKYDDRDMVSIEVYDAHKDEYAALKTIREQYKGMTIDGQKVYGI